MSSVLMCLDTIVYNIDTQTVYDSNLLPGYMQKNPCDETFRHWLKLRYSANTNTLARQLKGITFGQGNRTRINRETRAFSLSDCYWLKEEGEAVSFAQVSPYYQEFWRGQGEYPPGSSIPTLYVGGYLSKAWLDKERLYKSGPTIEWEASRLCQLAGIAVARVEVAPENDGVIVYNFTSPEVMLEQADQSGRLDPDDFTDADIVSLFGMPGIQMLIVDAILANGDRHAGNFGYLRDTKTGVYRGMAPLYDFDHALDSQRDTDRLMEDALTICQTEEAYQLEALRIAKVVATHTTNEVFRRRACYVAKAFL